MPLSATPAPNKYAVPETFPFSPCTFQTHFSAFHIPNSAFYFLHLPVTIHTGFWASSLSPQGMSRLRPI